MLIENDQVQEYRRDNTRLIDVGNGESRQVRMTPQLWEELEFVQIMEYVSTAELAVYAREEMQLQGISFDQAFRAVVAYLSNRWTP
ncbi:MAG: hypothetical protein KDA86_15940 [Planctomycetaceae bacterium]|nr:hypothetical protein [Planctomycetaceae bacterium]